MRIKSVNLKDFKRFTDTTVTDLPSTAKLVIIAGPNGCGKSSFFEGLNVWSRATRFHIPWDETYYLKNIPIRTATTFNDAITISFHDGDAKNLDRKTAVYIRSAHRNDPEFNLESLTRLGPAADENRLQRLSENDAAVSRNYQRLASQAMEDVFERVDGAMTVDTFRDAVIGEIRGATQRLFPELVMNSLGNPLGAGTFRFDKGDSKGFGYQNLSGGEKAAFDLILDLIVKRREYANTVFCIDEPEAHMNSRLQGTLLAELYQLIGDQSQLWLATHSAGMMRRARDIEAENPGTVIFLDFGSRDFDGPVVIQPERPSRTFWSRVLDVAFDDFANLIAPQEVVICEGSRIGESGKNAGMDAKIYEMIFASEYPDTRFIPAGNAHDVENDKLALIQTMNSLVQGTTVRRLIDRDDRSDGEVEESRSNGLSVLNRRNFECYLFDDDVISALYQSKEKADAFSLYLAYKQEEMRKAVEDRGSRIEDRGRPADDIKAIAGPLTNRIRIDLALTQTGSTPRAFALNVLAPFLSGTAAYEDLKTSVFGNHTA